MEVVRRTKGSEPSPIFTHGFRFQSRGRVPVARTKNEQIFCNFGLYPSAICQTDIIFDVTQVFALFAHGQCNSSCALIASNIQTQTQRGGDHFSTVIKILKTFVFFPENVNGFVKTRKTFSNRVKHHYTPAAV